MKKGIFVALGAALLIASGMANATKSCTLDGKAVHCDVDEILSFVNGNDDVSVGTVIRGNTVKQTARKVVQGNIMHDIEVDGVVKASVEQVNLVNQGSVEIGSFVEDRKVVNNDVRQKASKVIQGNVMSFVDVDGVNYLGKIDVSQTNLVNAGTIDINTDGNVIRNDVVQRSRKVGQVNAMAHGVVSGPALSGSIGQTNGVNVGSISIR